jgi:hypothetical protein
MCDPFGALGTKREGFVKWIFDGDSSRRIESQLKLLSQK